MAANFDWKAFADGGDIKSHEWNLRLTNMGKVATVAGAAGGLSYVASAWAMAGHAWPLYWTYNAARLADNRVLGYMSALSINGRRPTEFVAEFAGIYHQTFWFTSFLATGVAATAAYFAGKTLLNRFLSRAEAMTDVHLRGAELQTRAELIEKVDAMWADEKAKSEKFGQPMPHKYFLAGVPLPPKMAQRNILCTGGQGSGKSVAIFDLADQVAAAGRTMIIYDKVGGYARNYYRDGTDVIFNPFDARFPGWNLFNEIEMVYEFDQIASYLIPPDAKSDGGTSDYFKGAARTVLACVMQKLWEENNRTNEALCKAIFETGQEDLYEWLKGTPAESLLNPESKGTGGGGVLTTLTEAVKVLRYVPSGTFSLKKFIREGGDRRIVITSKEEVHEILKPLTAMAMNILYTTAMSGVEVHVDKYWFFMDEVRSMGALPVFPTASTEGRKFGVVTVIGAQNVAQIESMWGKDEAVTILSNLGNQLLLRVADEATAERYSKAIGAGEYLEQSNGISWGAASSKDGASVNTARKERRAVLASEIMLLKDCTGYLKLAGSFNIAFIAYGYRNRDEIALGIVWRDGLVLQPSAFVAPSGQTKVVPSTRQARNTVAGVAAAATGVLDVSQYDEIFDEQADLDTSQAEQPVESSATDAAMAWLTAAHDDPAPEPDAAYQ